MGDVFHRSQEERGGVEEEGKTRCLYQSLPFIVFSLVDASWWTDFLFSQVAEVCVL